MSLISPDTPSHELSTFRGAQFAFDSDDSPRDLAQEAQNVIFPPESVESRKGFAQAFIPADTLLTGYNFNHLGIDYLAYYNTNREVKLRRLYDGYEWALQGSIGSPGGLYRAIFIYSSGRLYYCIIDTNGNGVQEARIWDGSFPAPVNLAAAVRKAFHRPPLTSELTVTVTETGSGQITKGLHGVVLKVITKDGFTTKPGPINGSNILVPSTITASGGKSLQVQVSPSGGIWPEWIDSIQVGMSTVQQNGTGRYELVDGTLVQGLGGTGTVYSVTFSFSDATLRALETTLDDYRYLLSQDASGNGPFNPKGIYLLGDRLVWIATYGNQDCFFPSEKKNFQWITPNEHLLTMPDQAQITGAVVQGELLYGLSTQGIWAFTDSGSTPVTWGTPAQITGSFGIVHQLHSTQRKTGPGLLANPQGLHLLTGGDLSEIPLSYYQRDLWQNINWSDPLSIQLVDDWASRRILLLAPHRINGQQLYVWDYSRGLSLDKVNFTTYLLNIPGWDMKWLGVVKNYPNNVWELYISGETVGDPLVVRQKSPEAGDSSLYRDLTLGVPAIYKTCSIPNGFTDQVFNWCGLSYRVKGSGIVTVTINSQDEERVMKAFTRNLAINPGRGYTNFFDGQSEGLSVRILNNSNDNPDSWFRLIHVKAYYWPFVDHR